MSIWRTLLLTALAGALLAFGGGRTDGPASRPNGAVAWTVIRPGLEQGSLRIAAPGEGRWTRIVLLHIDPARYRLRVDTRLSADFSSAVWTVDSAPPQAVAAWNAGQFNGIAPWGWTVMDGLELRPPGSGPLSMAVVADSAGRISLVGPDSIEALRGAGGIATAFQSYPALLIGRGEVPAQLTTADRGVNVAHRDARLAMGVRADGSLLVLLTRFDGLGEAGGPIPFGLTLAETASLLKDQGAVRAVALDGGISSQLLLRAPAGPDQAWRGWRKVPLGVVLEARVSD